MLQVQICQNYQNFAETAEKLAATETDPSGTMRLYDGPAGAEAVAFLSDLGDTNTTYFVDAEGLAPALRSLMSRISVRSAHKNILAYQS